ncbi:DUF4982 domain-containing protein [Sphingobacterium olei]|uniref:DUF4982 domain-containing protein n=1 Tax=Sphingobacterium olei TaxID=2571155 RepID=A0A4U0P451_9SPHI|nr:malectin domain-containing carbohydrate-binding protein [Sphingobacterium olei]TJZ62161.1 DUF4982 domain-containing protein [Sphingobacterium olei]
MFRYGYFILVLIFPFISYAQIPREQISLDTGWTTVMDEVDTAKYEGFQRLDFNAISQWKQVQVPHNWDQYGGYRRQLHGNLHGYAWYRKTFKLKSKENNKRYYLFFEGVGSYATVWLNEKRVGYHAGGRTTFTLDVTDAIRTDGKENILAVRADHPADIRDLPWVDGGCSPERGFSEGSQPLGIFRPVSLIIKNEVNIVPFGVHYWNDEKVDRRRAVIQQTVEVNNTSLRKRRLTLETRVVDAAGKEVAKSSQIVTVAANKEAEFRLHGLQVSNPNLWSPDKPYLYQVETTIADGKTILDRLITPYGIRKISWPKGLLPNGKNQLFVNDKAVFIHGIAEYEHKLGNSHAFADEEISARVREMKSLGFNSFRDAHQPHNLRYQQFWDENGILLWTQMAAHIWFDNEAFRENFKNLLRDWVKERRNSPSIFLWGLENESTLPEEFARECTDIIRSMDPTASIQRLVTTCNGGSGTDWDVPQNWTGTYGGHHNTYGEDLKRQVLVGEYGAWRSLELHSEGPYLPNHNEYSEERFSEILQTKIRLADSVKNETIGHYLWLWNSHDNPGRVQGGEGFRDLDKIGPVNYKGILTPWGEPLDAYYMYRSHYAPKDDPMVYIAMHTWPNRWRQPGVKNNIRIYSNCDEVELFNDINNRSLGKRSNPGLGKHFEFNDVDIQYNVLLAEGKIKGKVVARDTILLHHLPKSPNYKLLVDKSELLKGQENFTYLYRVNGGGNTYIDTFGQTWAADQPYSSKNGWGSRSWGDDYNVNSYFASQRRVFDPIKGTEDWALFQTFRYGQDKLAFEFDVENGEYMVELYFAEPWIGTGGIKDGTGWRLFDVAINGMVVENKLDIWKEVGHDKVLKRTYKVIVENGKIVVNFPRIYSGQALIQAIAVAKSGEETLKTKSSHFNITPVDTDPFVLNSWMDIDSSFHQLPAFLYGSDYFQTTGAKRSFTFNYPTIFYVISKSLVPTYENAGDTVVMSTGEKLLVSRKIVNKGEVLVLPDVDSDAICAFQVQSGLQPAYDLKKTDSYKANLSQISVNVRRVDFQGQERLQYMAPDQGYVAWEIQVGVADIYALTFKYHNSSKETKSGFYEVLAKDGAILKPKTAVSFEPTREGKWNYLDENTSTMINAGTYIVKLFAADAKDVYVDNLDVQ